MTKMKINLPADTPFASGETETMWVEESPDHTYIVKNVPFFAKGISCEDVVSGRFENEELIFDSVIRRGGHSTYRIFAKNGRNQPEVLTLIDDLKSLGCDIEPATDRLVSVDVLPDADIYSVYDRLQQGEDSGSVDFQEGHCGHHLSGDRAGGQTFPDEN
jgi:hypothetical protein